MFFNIYVTLYLGIVQLLCLIFLYLPSICYYQCLINVEIYRNIASSLFKSLWKVRSCWLFFLSMIMYYDVLLCLIWISYLWLLSEYFQRNLIKMCYSIISFAAHPILKRWAPGSLAGSSVMFSNSGGFLLQSWSIFKGN